MVNNKYIPIFHYTKLNDWLEEADIRKSQQNTYLKPLSLQSLQREVRDPRADQRAIFALLDSTPQEWTNNPYFPTLWSEFVGTRGDLLLEIYAQINDPYVLIGEAAHVEGYLYHKNKQLYIPDKFRHTDAYTAFDDYQNSLITLEEYCYNGIPYVVPEVQIRRPVHSSELKISARQPLLEFQLDGTLIHDSSIHPIPSIYYHQDALYEWLSEYKKRNPWIEPALDINKINSDRGYMRQWFR